ncbi:hypothetical protein [Rhizobium gallicum]|uniref:hypothetical protein n=1 Tax=Rhizobium gallicum TaxID=56730 RepID=UPI00093F9A70|nr:hypothetical protein [Rhizobium gallicum]
MKTIAMTIVAVLFACAAAHADEVSVLQKKAWSTARQSGYVITYKHDGKIGKGAKVYCVSGGKPIYLVEDWIEETGKRSGWGLVQMALPAT